MLSTDSTNKPRNPHSDSHPHQTLPYVQTPMTDSRIDRLDAATPHPDDGDQPTGPTSTGHQYDFVYNDQTFPAELFEVAPITQLEMAAIAGRDVEPDDGESAAILMDTLKDVLGPNYNAWRRWTKKVRVPIPDIVVWVRDIIEVLSARPTEGQSPSGPGPLPTQTGSTEPGVSEPVTPPETESSDSQPKAF